MSRRQVIVGVSGAIGNHLRDQDTRTVTDARNRNASRDDQVGREERTGSRS
jgi:hypothetical protein